MRERLRQNGGGLKSVESTRHDNHRHGAFAVEMTDPPRLGTIAYS
jgi:hypothetical protein